MITRTIALLSFLSLFYLVNSLCLTTTLSPRQNKFLIDKQYVNYFLHSIYNECPSYQVTVVDLITTTANLLDKCTNSNDCNSDSACCSISLSEKICKTKCPALPSVISIDCPYGFIYDLPYYLNDSAVIIDQCVTLSCLSDIWDPCSSNNKTTKCAIGTQCIPTGLHCIKKIHPSLDTIGASCWYKSFECI